MSEKDKSVKYKLINGMLWRGGSNLIIFFITFGGSIILARFILPGVFGQFAYFLAVVEMCTLVTAISTSSTVIQNKKWPDSELAGAGFSLSLIFIGIYALLACFVGWFLFKDNLAIYLFLLGAKVCEMSSGIHAALVIKTFKFRQQSKVDLATTLCALLVAVLLSCQGYGLLALATQYVIMKIFMAGAMIWVSRGKLKYNFQKHYVNMFIRNGKQLWVATSVEKIRHNFAPLIISNFLNLKLLGIYNRGTSLAQRFSSLTFSLVQQVFLASFSEIQNDREKKSLLFNTTAFILIRITILISLLLACLSREFIGFLYGETWLPAAPVLRVAAFFGALFPMIQLCRTIHLSAGHFKVIKHIQMVEVFLFIVTLIVGVKTIGIIGAAWALNVTVAVILFLYLLSLQRFVDFKKTAILGLPLVSGLGLFILFSWLKSIITLPFGNFVIILVLTPAIVLCYLLLIVVFEKKQLRAIRAMLRSRS